MKTIFLVFWFSSFLMGKIIQKDYMQEGTFAELIEAAKQALAYERGAREGYRIVQVNRPVSPRRDPTNETVPPRSRSGFRRKHKNTSHK